LFGVFKAKQVLKATSFLKQAFDVFAVERVKKLLRPGLPDGIFSNQKSNLGKFC
jgi:hypothetical protein